MIWENKIWNLYLLELDLEYNTSAKYGILGVGFGKNKKLITGYHWSYKYWDDESIKVIHSYDLRILKTKVEAIGHEWVITDNCLAMESYKLNNRLIEKHDSLIKKKEGVKEWGGVDTLPLV